jgi:hypothetical protein
MLGGFILDSKITFELQETIEMLIPGLAAGIFIDSILR